MWGEIERSPMLAAPGSGNVTRLSTYPNLTGPDEEDFQGSLCEKYLPLALKIASSYAGLAIHFEDLEAAAHLGLVRASRKFVPGQGAFGPYAQLWIEGEITRLFKPTADAMSAGRSISQETPLGDQQDDENPGTIAETIADNAAARDNIYDEFPDLSVLEEKDRRIIEARARGETLLAIGKTLGISAERVRQREAKAVSKLRAASAADNFVPLRKWLPGSVREWRVASLEEWRPRRQHWLLPEQKRGLHWANFKDREPLKHAYSEPQPSPQLAHHRANASRLAALRRGRR
jgi:RNA polymerase sigma factor (sigma-70 family)